MASSSGVSWPASSSAACSAIFELPLEHRGVDHEVQVVRAVQRVEVQRPFAFDEPSISLHRRQIRHHRVAVVTAQHVDMGGHVLQVAGIGHQAAQQVGRGQRVLRGGRHLHGVQIQVQDAGMLPSGGRGQRIVQDPLGLDHPRARRRFAGAGVPQRPRGDVEQCVGGQGLHVDVVGIRLGQLRPWHRHSRRGRRAAHRCRPGRRWGSAPVRASISPRSTADARPLLARPSSIRARASDAARSTGSNASHALL